MTTRSFSVETRSQAVVIFGGPSALTASLIKEFLSKDVFAAKIMSTSELEDIRLSHDPDYLVVFEEVISQDLIKVLQPLISKGESHLIVVKNINTKDITIPLSPISKKIIYCDYVGDTEIDSRLISSWLRDIHTQRAINIPGDGLENISLLGIGDLVQLLSKAILYPSLEIGEELFLGNQDPISLLNLAYLVRTSTPFKLKLSFNETHSSGLWQFDQDILKNSLAKLDYQLVDNPETILKTYLKSHIKESSIVQEKPTTEETIQPHISPPKVALPKRESIPLIKKLTPLKTPQPMFIPLITTRPKTYSTKKAGPLSLGAIVARGMVVALALYLGTLAFSATIVALSLKHTLVVLQNDQLPSPSNLNNFTASYLQANFIAISTVKAVANNQSFKDTDLLLETYIQALSIFSSTEALSNSTGDIAKYILGSENIDIAQSISLSRLQAEELYQKLSYLDGSLPPEPPPTISSKYQDQYLEIKNKLGELKRSVTTTKAVLAIIPDTIGIGSRRKYAVLFQNNLELRATGGFIGSFAILTFENGKLYDMPIFDVYEVDGALKGHVKPPSPIKDILGELNWYLRDSNFDPDFPTSARRVEWFIKKSMNIDLNGTFAININTLASLLRATGPQTIQDYNETVTAQNIRERTQFYAEGNFFPGSSQKKEFLSTVASVLFTNLTTLGSSETLKFVSSLEETVQTKDTLISVLSPAPSKVFKALGWDGELSDLPCPALIGCHKDYAMVVDSNFGVNKANYFIKRDIQEVITLDKNLAINHLLRLSYQNNSPSTAWPAGIYKNYQRLYLPIGATISRIKVGEKILGTKDYTISEEHGKFVLAYLISVPVGDKLQVEVEYGIPQLPQENEFFYTWYWQKQPGTSSDDKLSVYLNYPNYLSPVVISPQAELLDHQLKFNLLNDTDHRVTVKFSR